MGKGKRAKGVKLQIFFPYKSIRAEQDRLLNDALQAIKEGKHLLAHAPTGLGKCCVFETPVLTENGLCQIGEIVESALEKSRVVTEDGVYSIPSCDKFLWAFNPKSGKIEQAKIKAFYKKEKCTKLFRVKTALGKEVTVTPEHPFFTLKGFEFIPIRASKLKVGDFIVCPNRISFAKRASAVSLSVYRGLNAYVKKDFGRKIKKLLIEELRNGNSKLVMRYWRLTNGLSCKAQAKALGVNSHTYYGWEYTKYRVPSKTILEFEKFIQETQLKMINADFLIKLVKERKVSESECKKAILAFGHPFTIKREKPIKPVWQITPELCRFVAYLIGDGYIHTPAVYFYNSDVRLLKDFEDISKKCFGIAPIRKKDKSTFRCELISKALVYFLRATFNFKMSRGRTNSGMHELPALLFSLPKEHCNAFLAAFIDCEAHITPLPSIEITTKSWKLAIGLSYLLLGYGLQTRIKKKVCSATNSPCPKRKMYYRLTFFGFAARKLLRELPIITKKQILNAKRENTNYDIIPINGKEIVKLRKLFFLSQSNFDKIIYLYEQNKRNPSRNGFRKLIAMFRERQQQINKIVRILQVLKQRYNTKGKSREQWARILKKTLKENSIPLRPLYGKEIGKNPSFARLADVTNFFITYLKNPLKFDLRKLDRLASNDVFFDRVQSVEKLKGKCAVYDITVESLHTFIGGNGPIVLHNTAAVLCPALSYSLQNQKTVFFLTPKISQHEIAVKLVNDLNKKFNLDILGIDLVGRRYMCSEPFVSDAENSAFYELCKRLRKKEACAFFANAFGFTSEQRAKAKLYFSQLEKQYKGIWHHLQLKDYCEAFKGPNNAGLCSYEIALKLAKKANIIVADYFHLLNPAIQRIVLQKARKKLDESIVIVDEAHNLPERLRKLLSATLSTKTIENAKQELEKMSQNDAIERLKLLRQALKKLAKQKLSENASEALLKREEFDSLIAYDIEELSLEFRDLALDYLEAFPLGRSSLLRVANFLEKWLNQDESFVRIIKSSQNKVSLQLKALDPSIISEPIFSEVHASILMSGTLLPTKMYADLLGFEEQRILLKEYSSPFPKENKLTLIVPSATTKYSERNFDEYRRIADTLAKIIACIPGNVAVFFPSFELLQAISTLLEEKLFKKILKQKERMNTKERFALLSEFRKSAKQGAVLFAVAAGSFAEGIDYFGKQLLCAIVVGIPLREMDLEQKCLIEYYQHKFGAGWHYGYLYPAIARAIQAAGRVIRDRNDKGVVVFLDKRYTWQNYAKCFPKDMERIVTTEPEKFIDAFWKKHS